MWVIKPYPPHPAFLLCFIPAIEMLTRTHSFLWTGWAFFRAYKYLQFHWGYCFLECSHLVCVLHTKTHIHYVPIRWPWTMHYISCFAFDVIKYLDRSNLRKKSVALSCISRIKCIIEGKSILALLKHVHSREIRVAWFWGSWPYCIQSQEADKDECSSLDPFLSFVWPTGSSNLN